MGGRKSRATKVESYRDVGRKPKPSGPSYAPYPKPSMFFPFFSQKSGPLSKAIMNASIYRTFAKIVRAP